MNGQEKCQIIGCTQDATLRIKIMPINLESTKWAEANVCESHWLTSHKTRRVPNDAGQVTSEELRKKSLNTD